MPLNWIICSLLLFLFILHLSFINHFNTKHWIETKKCYTFNLEIWNDSKCASPGVIITVPSRAGVCLCFWQTEKRICPCWWLQCSVYLQVMIWCDVWTSTISPSPSGLRRWWPAVWWETDCAFTDPSNSSGWTQIWTVLQILKLKIVKRDMAMMTF